MAGKLTLEWSYNPAGFFEEVYEYREKDYFVEIKEGRVVATLASTDKKTLSQEIHTELEIRFLAAQLLDHKPYQLSNYQVKETHPDGSATVEAHISAGATLSVGHVDTVLRDAAGNVKTDTKRERIDKRKTLASLASKYRSDPVVRFLLKSYRDAITDPQNELVYLYQIWDALKQGNVNEKNKACSAFKITRKQRKEWKRLGYLANEAPLFQGRHRGRKIGQLRDATSAELDEARTIAKNMIEAYLEERGSVGEGYQSDWREL